ncbi:hypothetical protein Lal_00018716 [Lupinus albus]|nr:hypothetical protein Lal_00018716 [Lupinus albus]
MVEDDMKVDEVMAPKPLPPKYSRPQRNFSHEKGKSEVFQEERKPYSRPTGSRGFTSHGPRTHANAGGSRLNSPSLCGKCGRTHVGDSCPGMALTCFHCKEVGHIRRHCPKLPQSVNAVRVDRPRSTGRVFTMSGTEASGVDGLIKEVDGRSKCSKFESGLKPKLKTMLMHQEIVDFATLVNKCRMVEDDMKADEVMAPNPLPPKHSGPQRNFSHEKGKNKVFQEERKPYSHPSGSRGYTSHGPRTHANVGGSRLNSPSLCGKCGRTHVGDSCPGMALTCFHYKEVGHIRRHCPKLPQSVNAVRVDRPRSTGRVFTMSGAEASGVDGLIKEIVDFATLVNKCRMVEDDMKVDEVMAPKPLPPKYSRPQRNFSHEKGKSEVFQEERKPYSRPTGSRGFTSHGPRTHANAGGSRLNSPSLCGKCGRTHVGDSCPGMALTCFHCKEVGHIRRHCPKLPQSVNAVRVDRPRSTGRSWDSRLNEKGSPGRVKSWAILKDSRLSDA